MRSQLLGLLFLSPLIIKSQGLSPDASRVQQVIRGMHYAMSDRDCSKLKLFCHKTILVLENNTEWTMDSLVQKINENKTVTDFKSITSFEFISTQLKQDVAWASYYILEDITKNQKRISCSYLETAILVKDDGYWKVKTLHSTPIKID